jgi:hypothetical protein
LSQSNVFGKAAAFIRGLIKGKLKGINQEVSARSYQAANELRTSALYVLRGQRGGRRYRIPYTKKTYQASAPGEPPAVRTGAFRQSWGTRVKVTQGGSGYSASSAIESRLTVGGHVLGELLEGGTSRMAPRPYKEAIKDRAMPKIQEIYNRPYKV